MIALVLLGSTIIFDLKLNSKSKKNNHESGEYYQKVTVKRKGNLESIDERELEVGDVMQLMAGMTVPCDSIVIKSDYIEVDESTITGNWDSVKKMNPEEWSKKIEQLLEENKQSGKVDPIYSMKFINSNELNFN